MAKQPEKIVDAVDESAPESHAARCKRELAEQEVILAKVREDSDRYDAAIAKSKAGTATNGENP